jgi:hypothetical protein
MAQIEIIDVSGLRIAFLAEVGATWCTKTWSTNAAWVVRMMTLPGEVRKFGRHRESE